MAEGNRYARTIAGSLELFVGAYFITFGTLAILFFEKRGARNFSYIAGAFAFFGTLLVWRAEKLLGWHRWMFWVLVGALLVIPIVWYLPIFKLH
jgi:hypothetical protein